MFCQPCHDYFRRARRQGRWQGRLDLGIVLSIVFLAGFASEAKGDHPIPRSLDWHRNIPPHEYPDSIRQSHHGWEVRRGSLVVVATTRLEDAQWAVETITQAWTDTAQLADLFTDQHRSSSTPSPLVQVVIDSESVRDRSRPDAMLATLSDVSVIHINVGRGNLPLRDQIIPIREAATHVFLHSYAIDRALPEWVRLGMASSVARSGGEIIADGIAINNNEPLVRPVFGLQRRSSDQLESPPLASDTEAWFRFLLLGDDARHAPLFLEALAESIEASSAEAFDRRVRRRHLQEAFESWRENPSTYQPEFIPDEGLSQEVVDRQQDMVFWLKLIDRLYQPPVVVRPRLTLFDPAVPHPLSIAPARSSDFRDFSRQIRDPRREAWATIDTDGRLLLSSEHERWSDLLADAEHNYLLLRMNDQSALAHRFDDGRIIIGTLAPNTQNATQSVAQFEIISAE